MDMIERDKKRREKRLQKAGVDPNNPGGKQKQLTVQRKDTRRVKKPRPISEAGSTYKTGRKAIAEKKAKENAEKRAKAQAAARNNNKNSNKKKNNGKGKKR
jgi:hypothetical protein